jgi:hypothetical protein
VTDKARTERSVQTELSSRAAWRLLTRRRRAYILFIETMLILVVALAGHMTGRELGRRHLMARDETIQQLREERQEISAELTKRNDRIRDLQTRLNTVQAALDAIVPSENTYNINPNQSLILAGRLNVGLIGSPTNQSVTLNINGKEQVVASGDVITVPVDGKTSCQITVQSFDMFKAVLNASCAAKK